MGISKAEVFNESQNQVAQFAKAFAHPARVAILEYLVKRGTCVCGELVGLLPLSQSTISQHLKELKRIGLVKGQIDGPSICYCIDKKAWKEARSKLTGLFKSFECGC